MQEEAEPAARKGATPPPTDAQRLWARYQLPKGKQRPTDRLPVGRYDWNLLVLRLDIPTHVKAIAGALATLGRADGSNVVTTDPCLPPAFGINERQLRRHIAVLHDLKLLEVIEQPGGRGVTKTVDEKRRVHNAIVCQLTEPADGKLPYRLDPQLEPIELREPGAAPLKAIEASRAARARNTGSESAAVSGTPARNSGSAATGATAKHRQPGYRSNDETAVAAVPEQDQNTGSGTTGVSGSAPWKQRQPGYRSNDETAVAAVPEQDQNTGTPATAVFDAPHGSSGTAATAATPVDNPPGDEKPRQPGYRSSPETPVAGLPEPRYSGYRSNENTGTAATGAASREEVLKNPTTKNPLNPTTRVVQLGGDLTSDAADDTQSDSSPSVDEQSAWDPAAFGASQQPTEDPEYDQAREIVWATPIDEIDELLSNAQLELEAESGHPAVPGAGPNHRQILVRAAEIVRRAGAVTP